LAIASPPAILWHATTPKKLARYQASRAILPPVRGFDAPAAAAEWARLHGRSILMRLPVRNAQALPDHHLPEGLAWWTPYAVPLVGCMWKAGEKWYEQTAAGTWELPIYEIDRVTFGVRVVCGELELLHLAGPATVRELVALDAELRRACRSELGDLLGLDEGEMDRVCGGRL
jgi:hypothetical protein